MEKLFPKSQKLDDPIVVDATDVINGELILYMLEELHKNTKVEKRKVMQTPRHLDKPS